MSLSMLAGDFRQLCNAEKGAADTSICIYVTVSYMLQRP